MSKKGANRLDITSVDPVHWAECFCEQFGLDDEVASNLHPWFANYWAAVNDPLQIDSGRLTGAEAEVGRLADENFALKSALQEALLVIEAVEDDDFGEHILNPVGDIPWFDAATAVMTKHNEFLN